MSDYLFLFRGGLNFATATQEQLMEAMGKWKNWITELTNKGIYNGGNRLAKTGATLTGNKKQVSDGPYTEAKEIVGGYISVKANDLKEAIEIAKDCPIFNYNGIVEVREVATM